MMTWPFLILSQSDHARDDFEVDKFEDSELDSHVDKFTVSARFSQGNQSTSRDHYSEVTPPTQLPRSKANKTPALSTQSKTECRSTPKNHLRLKDQ